MLTDTALPLIAAVPIICISGGTVVFLRSLEELCGLYSFGLEKHQH
jgi:hypothetical protein